jgi:hypothetical protein
MLVQLKSEYQTVVSLHADLAAIREAKDDALRVGVRTAHDAYPPVQVRSGAESRELHVRAGDHINVELLEMSGH